MERGRGGSRRRQYVRLNSDLPISRDGVADPAHGANSGNKRSCQVFGPEHVQQVGTTEIEMESFAFFWNLKTYSVLSASKDEIRSPKFSGGSKSNHSWQLKLTPRKIIGEEEHVSVHLLLAELGDGSKVENKTVKARFEICLLDADGQLVKQGGSSIMEVCVFKEMGTWGFDKFILCNDLISPTRRLLENDELKLQVRVWIEGEVKHVVMNGGAANRSPGEDEKIKKRRDRLASDFGKLYKDSTHADISVTTGSKAKIFLVHKAVLAARSSVFAAMFSVNMTEKEFNKVIIQDFDDEIVGAMLEHIYTGETAILKQRAPELLQISEKYDLAGLKEDSQYVIADNLTVENSAEMLVLADMYTASILKPKALDFININKKAVEKTASFQRMRRNYANVFVDLYLSK